jgi:hypothetical protein
VREAGKVDRLIHPAHTVGMNIKVTLQELKLALVDWWILRGP